MDHFPLQAAVHELIGPIPNVFKKERAECQRRTELGSESLSASHSCEAFQSLPCKMDISHTFVSRLQLEFEIMYEKHLYCALKILSAQKVTFIKEMMPKGNRQNSGVKCYCFFIQQ